MKTLFISLTMLFVAQVQAQLTKPVSKLMLYSGDVLTGEHLIYESAFLKTAQFALDNETHESSTVAFFQNSHGYFANLGRIHGLNSERYALRIKTGKINLYEEIDIAVYGGEELKTETTNNPQDPMLATGNMYNYYSKGDEPVREATYANLKVDMADNDFSMKHLHNYRNYRFLQWGLIGVGSGIIASSVIAQSGHPVKFNPMMALGIVIGGSSYFLETPKEDELWIAADEYNKNPEQVLSEVN